MANYIKKHIYSLRSGSRPNQVAPETIVAQPAPAIPHYTLRLININGVNFPERTAVPPATLVGASATTEDPPHPLAAAMPTQTSLADVQMDESNDEDHTVENIPDECYTLLNKKKGNLNLVDLQGAKSLATNAFHFRLKPSTELDLPKSVNEFCNSVYSTVKEEGPATKLPKLDLDPNELVSIPPAVMAKYSESIQDVAKWAYEQGKRDMAAMSQQK